MNSKELAFGKIRSLVEPFYYASWRKCNTSFFSISLLAHIQTNKFMKQFFFLLIILLPFTGIRQTNPDSGNGAILAPGMKIGMIIYSNDPETVWNAFRFGNFALEEGDSVRVFLLAKGVECERLNTKKFSVTDQIRRFIDNWGKVFACGSCLTIRQKEGSEMCPLSTMQDMYDMVKWSDKVLTF